MLKESAFEELLRYVSFGEADLERLRALHRVAEPRYTAIAAEFYERIREHADAHAVFSSEAQIARQQLSLVAWIGRMCTAPRDSDYFARSSQIGRVHVRVGMPQRYVFSAMALIRVALERAADELLGDAAPAVRASLSRALDLELALMVESYREDFVARLQRVEQLERADLGRRLASSEERYQQAVELAPYLVIGLDAKGDVVLFNGEATRVTGYALDEVLGRSVAEVLFENADPIGSMLARKSAADEAPEARRRTLEARLRTRSGAVRHVIWQIAQLSSTADQPAATYMIGRDVTDEQALAERTKNAEKLAAVGTLAAGLAHEIRNPLNGAQLHLTFLERGLKKSHADPDALEAVSVVSDEIRRLSNLVNEFLDFARPKPLSRKRVALQSVVERVCGMVAPDAAAHGAQLVTDLPSTPLEAEIDVGKIEQVLLNLVRNAIEAMAPSGGGGVTIRLRRQPFHALIEVEDEGPGLPDPNAPIFDAFFSTKAEGTGLGLSIVHRIVTDHGGTIAVDSRPGRTNFAVTLPL